MTPPISQKLMLALSIFLTMPRIHPFSTAMGQSYRPHRPQQEAALLNKWMTCGLLVRWSRGKDLNLRPLGYEAE